MKSGIKICLLLLIPLVPSCASKKKITATPTANCRINKQELPSYFPLLDSASKNWLKIKGKAKAELANKNYHIDVQLRVKPNDTIWISLTKSSFPLLKVLLAKDSVFAMDLFHKKYLTTNYSGLSEKIGTEVNFSILQSILLGQYLPLAGDQSWLEQDQIVYSNCNQDSLRAHANSFSTLKEIVWGQWLNCSSKSISKQYLQIPSKKEEMWVKCTLPDSSLFVTIPQHIEVTTYENKSKKLSFSLTYNKFKQAQKMKVPFKIPDNYGKMD